METLPKPTGLVNHKGEQIQNTRWVKGPYPYVPFKKLLQKMLKLERKYERAAGQATKARIMKSYAHCEKVIKGIKKQTQAQSQTGCIILPTKQNIQQLTNLKGV